MVDGGWVRGWVCGRVGGWVGEIKGIYYFLFTPYLSWCFQGGEDAILVMLPAYSQLVQHQDSVIPGLNMLDLIAGRLGRHLSVVHLLPIVEAILKVLGFVYFTNSHCYVCVSP